MSEHRTQAWAESLFDYDPLTGVVCLRRMVGRRGQRGDGVGYIDDLGYRRIYVEGKSYRAHQIAWLLTHSIWCAVDHKNGNRLDNRLCNLRAATKSQNAVNTSVRADNVLGIKGVSICQATGKYRASIRCNGKSINLGRYTSLEAAKAVYDAKARELFGEFARS